MSFSVEYIYRIIDKFSGPLEKITRNTERFQNSMKRSAAGVTHLGNKLDSVGSKLSNIGGAIGGAAIAASIFTVTKEASNMEDAMGDVSRVTSMSGKNLDRFEDKLERMSIATGKGALGLAAIATEGGKLGIADKNMAEFVTTVSKAAMAFDITDEEAGRSIGSIGAKLGLAIPAIDTLLQRVNYLADNTSASGNQMIEIIERTAGTFKMLKIPPAVTAGWAAFANQMETSPELAASGLNMMMSRMMKMPGMMNKMLKDPTNTVKDFLAKLGKIPEAKRGCVILKLFGEEAARFVMKAVTSMDKLNQAMKLAGSDKALGSMDREFENIMKRSSTMGRRLLAIFTAIRKSIGKIFLDAFDKVFPILEKIGMKVFNFTKAHPGLVKIAGAFGAILVAIVGITIPIGLMLGILAAGLPIISAILTAIGSISVPFVVAGAAIAALIGWFVAMWNASTTLRGAVSNLADAFSPLTNGLKIIGQQILKFVGYLFSSGPGMQTWGDALAFVINGIAAMVKSAFSLIDGYFKILIPLISGDFTEAWDMAKIAIKAFSDFFTPIIDFWVKKIEKLVESVKSLKNINIKDFAKGVGNKALNMGKDALSVFSFKLPDMTQKVNYAADKLPDMTQKVNYAADKLPDMTQKVNYTADKLPDMTQKVNYAASTDDIGYGAASNKTKPTAGTNFNVTGNIGVQALEGTRVDRASIYLNSGSNMAAIS